MLDKDDIISQHSICVPHQHILLSGYVKKYCSGRLRDNRSVKKIDNMASVPSNKYDTRQEYMVMSVPNTDYNNEDEI